VYRPANNERKTALRSRFCQLMLKFRREVTASQLSATTFSRVFLGFPND